MYLAHFELLSTLTNFLKPWISFMNLINSALKHPSRKLILGQNNFRDKYFPKIFSLAPDHNRLRFLLAYLIMYHRTNVLCCKERSPQKKKYSNSKVREENIAVIFIQLWSLQLEKFILVASFFSLPFGGDGVWVRAGCLTYVCHSRLGRTDRGLGTFDSPVLKAAFNSLPKSHYLFSYVEILENKSKILECSMSLVKHVIIHL